MSPLSQWEITSSVPWPFVPELGALVAQAGKMSKAGTPELFARIWIGSMPGLISANRNMRDVFYSSYVSTHIERDVRELSGAIDALKFKRFIVSCAARTGQLVNYTGLAEDSDTDVKTAKSWLGILEALGIVFLLHPYANNVLKRTVSTPKLSLIENYTISELIKGYQNAGLEPFLYFYRDRDSKEIDVILERDGTLYPLEIKKTALPSRGAIKAFDIISKSPLKRGTGAVLSLAKELSAFDNDKLIVPIWII